MLAESILAIDDKTRVLVEQAEALIEDYWTWYTEQTRVVWAAIKRGEQFEAGRIAPSVERKSSGESVKHYLKWKNYGGQYFRRSNKSAGADLAVAATVDYSKAIKRHGTWEVPRALELEEKLIPLRIAIEGLHEAKVRLRAAERKFERHMNKEKA